jgi:hypothetical protein
MKLETEHVRAMAKAIDLTIPEDELLAVAIRLSALLEVMETIEGELGEQMDTVDPVPPVFAEMVHIP